MADRERTERGPDDQDHGCCSATWSGAWSGDRAAATTGGPHPGTGRAEAVTRHRPGGRRYHNRVVPGECDGGWNSVRATEGRR